MSNLPTTEATVEPQPLVIEPVDIQHDTDPADDHGPSRRIPHLGHAILFFSLASMFLGLSLIAIWAVFHIQTEEAVLQHPGIGLGAQALAYLLTILASAWVFPRLWNRTFLQGIQWNALAAKRHWYKIVPAAVALSAAAQVALNFLPHPDKSPITDIMSSPRGAWFTFAFAVLLAPLAEELAFRGFLLPSLATAYDWLALDRTPAGLQKWESSTFHSTFALVFAALFSSIPFALLHAGQLSHAWAIVGVLYVVSLVLSFVRIRTHSLACSVLLHGTYNFTIFASILIATGGFRHLDKLAS